MTDEEKEKRGLVKCVGCERWHRPWTMATQYRCDDCAPEFEEIPKFVSIERDLIDDNGEARL